jgi:hypothetical protein
MTPSASVINPSNGKDGLSNSSLSAKAFGIGTSAVAKSTSGNVLRKIGTPMSEMDRKLLEVSNSAL